MGSGRHQTRKPRPDGAVAALRRIARGAGGGGAAGPWETPEQARRHGGAIRCGAAEDDPARPGGPAAEGSGAVVQLRSLPGRAAPVRSRAPGARGFMPCWRAPRSPG
ncbi:hypothetical protein GCM10010964_38310 [Caldovatus sediminis]|uniref:Uncharacterized protein n=1 Tax=Caldovatus sediminis TaxID=2041189 RepID=A0A8J3ECK3_9PROT|nr:hypothetical protein GCM10010964_38310 [Caldovatus sediminis]